MKQFSEEIMQKYFSFELFLHYFKSISNSEKKKGYRTNFYAFHQKLYNTIKSKQYKPERYSCFFVKEPKPREIFAPNFEDRIIHHLIIYALKDIENSFIDDSFANRKGKGTHAAIKRTQYFIRQYSKKECYYMQCDVKSYFPSINKHILFQILFKHLDNLNFQDEDREFIVYLLNQIILQNPTKSPIFTGDKHLLSIIPPHKSLFYQPNHKGLPIGSLTSQFFSLIYLNELDQFIKNELKIKHYIRYVDDFVIFEESTKNFKYYQDEINSFLKTELDLQLHPNKTKIQQAYKGLDFLGYIIRPHYLLVRKRTINNFKNRLRFFNWLIYPEKYDPNKVLKYYETLKLSKYYRQNLIKPPLLITPVFLKDVLQTINSYYGIFSFANSYNLRRKFYEEHFKSLKEFFYPKNSFRGFGIKPIIPRKG